MSVIWTSFSAGVVLTAAVIGAVSVFNPAAVTLVCAVGAAVTFGAAVIVRLV